jgi:bleomycin hydrolase
MAMKTARKCLASALVCALLVSAFGLPAWAEVRQILPQGAGAVPQLSLKLPAVETLAAPAAPQDPVLFSGSLGASGLSAAEGRPAELVDPAASPAADRNMTVGNVGESLHAIKATLDVPKNGSDDTSIADRLAVLFEKSGLPSVARSAAELPGIGDAISPADVKKMIAETQDVDPQTLRLRDSVQRLGFANTALNHEVLAAHNNNYTVQTTLGPVQDQKKAGICWLEAATEDLNATLVAEGKLPKGTELSQAYLHFWNMFEKANTVLTGAIAKLYSPLVDGKISKEELRMMLIPQLDDGGLYEFFKFLVAKYGLVPKEAMGTSVSLENTTTMTSELQDDLAMTTRELMANALQYKAGKAPDLSAQIKYKGIKRILTILVTHLGKPPLEGFVYQALGKARKVGTTTVTPSKAVKYTPQEFAQKVARYDPEDHIVVGSFSGLKPGVYTFDNSSIGIPQPGKPSFNVRFMNVSPQRFEQLTMRSIKHGSPVWFSADVTRDVDYASGIMHPRIFDRAAIYNFPESERAAKLSRKEMAYFNRITPDHAMLFTGYDQPDLTMPPIKYQVQNSWSKLVGFEGYFAAYREWVLKNVFEVVIHRRYFKPSEKKAWDGEAKTLQSEADWY